MDNNNLLVESSYNTYLINDAEEIVLNYFNIVKEYLFHAGENIIIQDYSYYIFIIKRGLDCLKHIFNTLLLYTNNLELVVYHCKKSYLYYIEFISQIGNENHSYLQLNSKDAALFVYKKTIFDIHNEVRSNFTLLDKNKDKIKYLNYFCEIINEIVLTVFDNENIKGEQKISYIMYIISMTSKIKDKIVKSKKSTRDKIKYCKVINYFLKSLKLKKITDECKYLNISNLITRKILNQKHIITTEKIDKKILDKDFDTNLNCYTPLKFINWFLNI
tara:strand:+ start:95 stop:916 length:822 start_codon:yes stop_codon:yes gene_type:complete